ncbi:MAG: periplasmic glucan biosynthesis protein MdoG, partial [Myxococcaceae bacterium]|nr:periplasmic glucan biosynthesis protein MdoG [Myxococcaceae bacterium]
TARYRAQFDLTLEGNDTVELRVFLLNGEQTLTETWAYQFEPRA